MAGTGTANGALVSQLARLFQDGEPTGKALVAVLRENGWTRPGDPADDPWTRDWGWVLLSDLVSITELADLTGMKRTKADAKLKLRKDPPRSRQLSKVSAYVLAEAIPYLLSGGERGPAPTMPPGGQRALELAAERRPLSGDRPSNPRP
jgi:hypothetical protein